MGIKVPNVAGSAWRNRAVLAGLTALSLGCFLDPPTKATGSPGFTVDLVFAGTPHPALRAASEKAVARIESIITKDLPDASFNAFITALQCGVRDAPNIDGTIDDIMIIVATAEIDEFGGTPSAGGPCALRDFNFTGLPSIGVVVVDIADLDGLSVSGHLDDAVMHQMMHALGFGTGAWEPSYFNLLVSQTGSTVGYLGVKGEEGCRSIGGTLDQCHPIPVELGLDYHWREELFGNELMTGSLPEVDGQHAPLSLMSIMALADMGYTVDVTKAEAFTIAASVTAARSSQTPSSHGALRPAVIVQADGSTRPITRR